MASFLSVWTLRRGPIAAILFLVSVASGFAQSPALKTERVLLVTIDGVRIQEAFGGIDPVILDGDKKLAGIQDASELRNRFMRPTPEERRAALMPFLWSVVAREGVILGNPACNNRVKVTNSFRVSYPGYAEILTGCEQPKVASNLPFRMPRETILEVLKKEKGWTFGQVAAFCSWQTFNLIVHREADAFLSNAGFARVPSEWATPGMEPLNTLQMEMFTPWDLTRFDRVTAGLAEEYVKVHKPMLLYLGLGEPDDWGHERRYDRMIQTIHECDRAIQRLWDTVQAMEEYRGKTTMIILTDHGRGVRPEDWPNHDRNTPGSEDIWIAVLGPDTPALGESREAKDYTQGQVAATLARFFGVDYPALYAQAAPALDLVFPKP